MNKQDFTELGIGDIVKHKDSWPSYVVAGNYGGRVTAVKIVDMTNPDEWVLMQKCKNTASDINAKIDEALAKM